MRLTIVRKGLILILVPLAFQLALLWLFHSIETEHIAAEANASHSQDVIAKAHEVTATVLDAQTASRGYAISQDAEFVAPYNRAIEQMPTLLGELEALVADNHDQALRAARIRETVKSSLDWQRVNVQWVREGKAADTLERIKSGTGERLVDEVRAGVNEFLAVEQQLSVERDRSLAQARENINWIVLGGTALSFVGTLALAVFFSQGISRRLHTLVDNSMRMMQSQPLNPPVSGSDEISHLDDVLHRTATTLTGAATAQRQYTELLEGRVAERTRELERINRDLAEQMRENELFVYSVSHDLRSPLVNLQGFSQELGAVGNDLRGVLADPAMPESIRQRTVPLVDDEMQKCIRFIQGAVSRLNGIIEALLGLSRAGRVEYQVQRVDVTAIVDRIVEAMAATAQQRGAQVTIGPLPPVRGDAQAIDQLLANLINNALNYLDPARPGRIEIGCRASPSASAVTGPTNGDAGAGIGPPLLVFFVKDNGLGIPQAYQAKLFQAFKRLHPHTARGEGMGLAIVRRIVERHAGRVWVESTEGVGSTFFVSLPAWNEPEGRPGSSDPSVQRNSRNEFATHGHPAG